MALTLNADGFVLAKADRGQRQLTKLTRGLLPVTYMTPEEVLAYPAGSVFVFDVETYINFFFVAFMCVQTGRVITFEQSPRMQGNFGLMQMMMWKFCIVGFNSRNYDMPIITYAITGKTNEQIKDASDRIILGDLLPYAFEKEFKVKIPRLNHIDLIEVCPLSASLKTYGGRVHCKRMQDLPFPPSHTLTEEQADFVGNYCCNDLETTALILYELREQIDMRVRMSAEYETDLRSKSDAQIAEAVLSSEVAKINGYPCERPTIPEGTTFQYKPPAYLHFQTPAFQAMFEAVKAATFFVDGLGTPRSEAMDGLTVACGNSVYRLGAGGLHSSEKVSAHVCGDDEIISDNDVESYYPRIIINQGLYPQHLGPAFLQVYSTIVNRRVAAKRSGDKTTADSLKITINGTFGKLGSKWSILFAPDLLIQVTVSGQLSLLMLIEMLELWGCEVISANTDGIILKYKKAMHETVRNIIKQWEEITGFNTEETRYHAVYSRDVNNYVAVKYKQDKETKAWTKQVDGTKGKGAYNNPWGDPKEAIFRFFKNPECSICIEAVIALITKNVPLTKTIGECTDVRKFVKVRNVKGGGERNGIYLGKVVRWYHAKHFPGTINYVGSGNKVPKSDGGKPCMDLPEAFPDDIDFDWYVAEATEILYDIGFYKRAEAAQLKFW